MGCSVVPKYHIAERPDEAVESVRLVAQLERTP